MSEKTLPISEDKIREILEAHKTPFHIYDAAGIRRTVRAFLSAFSWAPDFREFFAVKALPNPHIMKLLKDMGLGMDTSSLAELVLCEKTGITGPDIMFSSNDTPAEEFRKARDMGAIVNLDDIGHIDYLQQHAGLPEMVSLRFNPGPERTGNAIIGNPSEAKYGFTRDQLFEGYRLLQEKGVKQFGLHTMVASNELNPGYLEQTAVMLFSLAVEIKKRLGIRLAFTNMGGGIGIPYRPEDHAVNFELLSAGVRRAYEEYIVKNGLDPLPVCYECGRAITGPHGYLVTRVLHIKKTYKNYAGLDASMHNLMRPALYGAYHHISVLGKEDKPRDHTYDVTGSLCENNDKFAIDRELPELTPGDTLVIHDTGAHGHAMGFNYNGKLRSAEILLEEDGSFKQIRRAETLDDLFATLDFTGLKD